MANSKLQHSLTGVIAPRKFKILLITAPGKLTNLLKLELSHEEYIIEVTHDRVSGLLKCGETQPQLIVIDWSIASFSACDLFKRLRFGNNSILVLTQSDKVGDRVAALNAGADDCLSQPFSMTEFLAKIRAHLRRHYQNQKLSVLSFEGLNLDTLTREVYCNDIYVYLTAKEFNLLKYFMVHPRQVLTRTQIIDRIWGFDYMGSSNVIEVYVRYLRLKIERNNFKRLIHTVRGVGYVLRESSF